MNPHFTRSNRFAAAFALAVLVLIPAAGALAQDAYRWGPPSTPPVAQPLAPLTAGEAKWLAFMREEEKLARDVYQQLYVRWNLLVFRNITASEDNHYEAVGTLLARYGAQDPARGLAAGVYANPQLTALHGELMAKGMRSAKDALEVGVLIEKTDIADLEDALKGTVKLDIKRVYTNLMNGSFNHQDAFETMLELLG